eukprot:TRINITY_DN10538_c0_g1_i1.p1 TRINITY_DN10538_c0_g1~~TRINITY_DN10538_c0_g1_i1.p1  ORF type:complete len:100 (-),score=13.08 TRINITY_DN10538_c0_g1_i1:3-302(-)
MSLMTPHKARVNWTWSVDLNDPLSNVERRRGLLKYARDHACMVVWRNKFYVFGGWSGPSDLCPYIEMADLDMDGWETVTLAPTTYHPVAASAVVLVRQY